MNTTAMALTSGGWPTATVRLACLEVSSQYATIAIQRVAVRRAGVMMPNSEYTAQPPITRDWAEVKLRNRFDYTCLALLLVSVAENRLQP